MQVSAIHFLKKSQTVASIRSLRTKVDTRYWREGRHEILWQRLRRIGKLHGSNSFLLVRIRFGTRTPCRSSQAAGCSPGLPGH